MLSNKYHFREIDISRQIKMALMLSVAMAMLMFAAAMPVHAQQTSGGAAAKSDRSATPVKPAPAAQPGAAASASPPRLGADSRPSYAEQVQATEDVSVLVVAGQETTLSGQMGGRILRVHVGLGESVAAGAPLLDFDCAEQEAQQQAAVAEYRAARETHLTKLRLQALGAAGELEVTVAAASADKAKSQVDLRESQMAYCRVASPFAGRVARLRVKASESATAGQPLVELVNTDSLKAQMFVPGFLLRTLRPGMPLQVRMEDGRVHRARIVKLNSRVEGVSQQLEVEGLFDGPAVGLLPGMVGTAIFPRSAPAAATTPRSGPTPSAVSGPAKK